VTLRKGEEQTRLTADECRSLLLLVYDECLDLERLLSKYVPGSEVEQAAQRQLGKWEIIRDKLRKTTGESLKRNTGKKKGGE
jgi:hypothetical protein